MSKDTEAVFSSRNYSMEANYQALEDLVQANPELWSDKYLLGTGAQLLRVISAGQSANGVRTLQALYESMIGFMQRRDSILGFGETMGFSAFRGSNDTLSIIAVADTNLSIPARSVVGSVGSVDLVNTTAIVVNRGQTFSFTAKVGNLKTENRSIVDTEYKYIRFLSPNISDDVVFKINDIETPYVTAFKDAFSDTDTTTAYALFTNAFESVDLFIINRGDNLPLETSDVYTLNYIEYTDMDYTLTDIEFNHGEIQSVTQLSEGEPPQSVESLRACIPYFRDTQREVLANRDPMKVLRLLMPNVQGTAGTNLNSVHSLLTYKYADDHLVPDAQLKDYEKYLAPTYYFGFCPSNIVQPIQFNTGLDIEIVLFSPQTEITNIQDMVNDILLSYEKLPTIVTWDFTEPVNLDDVESELNKLRIDNNNAVKTAYVNIHSEDMTEDTTVELGKVYKENDRYLRVKGFNYEAGAIPLNFVSKYTVCGHIILEKWRLIYGYKQLETGGLYQPDDIVGISDTQVFRVHPYYTLSSIEPEWNTEIGGLTYGADLVWLTIKHVTGTYYVPGEYAIKGMIVTPAGSDVSYQLIGFTKTVDTLEDPSIVAEVYLDGTDTREIYNLWNSYTKFSIESLNIHV